MLYTTKHVSAILGIKERTVRFRAMSRDVKHQTIARKKYFTDMQIKELSIVVSESEMDEPIQPLNSRQYFTLAANPKVMHRLQHDNAILSSL